MTIKGVPVELLDRLRDRAADNRRSLNSEVIALLEEATMDEDGKTSADMETLRQETMRLRERLRKRYGAMSDSTLLIREDRDER